MGYQNEKDENFLEAVKLFEEAKQKEVLFTSLDKFNSRATLLQEKGCLFSVLSLDPIKNVNINIKKNETEKLGHCAGSRVLASSEQLLMYALATNFVQSGAIILAPEHDGMVVLPSPGFKLKTTCFDHVSKVVFNLDFPFEYKEINSKSIDELWGKK